jgi:hypothetical protein
MGMARKPWRFKLMDAGFWIPDTGYDFGLAIDLDFAFPQGITRKPKASSFGTGFFTFLRWASPQGLGRHQSLF